MSFKLCLFTVFFFQLRKTVFDIAQKELAPISAEIDKTDEFPQRRVS